MYDNSCLFLFFRVKANLPHCILMEFSRLVLGYLRKSNPGFVRFDIHSVPALQSISIIRLIAYTMVNSYIFQ